MNIEAKRARLDLVIEEIQKINRETLRSATGVILRVSPASSSQEDTNNRVKDLDLLFKARTARLSAIALQDSFEESCIDHSVALDGATGLYVVPSSVVTGGKYDNGGHENL